MRRNTLNEQALTDESVASARRRGSKAIARSEAQGDWEATGARIALDQRRLVHAGASGAVEPRGAHGSMQLRAQDGKRIRLLTVMAEYSRECQAIRAGRHLHVAGGASANRAESAGLQSTRSRSSLGY